jgi:hypothetical protein
MVVDESIGDVIFCLPRSPGGQFRVFIIMAKILFTKTANIKYNTFQFGLTMKHTYKTANIRSCDELHKVMYRPYGISTTKTPARAP